MYDENVDPDLKPEIIEMINKKYKGNYEEFARDMLHTSVFMNEKALDAFIDKPNCKN